MLHFDLYTTACLVEIFRVLKNDMRQSTISGWVGQQRGSEVQSNMQNRSKNQPVMHWHSNVCYAQNVLEVSTVLAIVASM